MKIGFISSVEIGKKCIPTIYEQGYQLDLLLTIPDNAQKENSGRVYFDDFSNFYNFPIYKFHDLNILEVKKLIIKKKITHFFVIGWSQLIKNYILSINNVKFFGMHPSPLPIGRGRAPIPNSIIFNLKKTAVSLFEIDEGVDSGPIIDQEFITLNTSSTSTLLYKKSIEAHKLILRRNLDFICKNKYLVKKQDESKATYWPKRSPKDSEIKNHHSINEALRLFNACKDPYPNSFVNIGNYKYLLYDVEFKKIVKKKNDMIFELTDGYLYMKNYKKIRL